MLHLLCVPAGSNASEVLFKKAMQQEYGRTMLVTSSTFLVQKARIQGVNAVNFDYLANAVLRRCGRVRVRRISRTAQELIVGNILQSLQEKGRLPYFAKLVGKKGFLRSVTSLMDQLGSCGVTPEEIAGAFSHWDGRSGVYRQKDRETAEIYTEYIRYLIAHDVYDVAGMYRLAAEELEALLQQGSALPWDTLFFMGFYQFDAWQLSIICSLSRLCDVWVALPYEASRPGLYGATEYTYGDLMRQSVPERIMLPARERNASLQHLVKALRNPEAKPVPADAGIEIWKAEDRTEEMRSVLRDIKLLLRKQIVKAEEVAVVLRRMEDYSGLRSLCDEYGIPAQLRGNASLTANPVFRYILTLLSSVSLHGRDKAESWGDFLTQPLQRIALGLPTQITAVIAKTHYYTDYKILLTDVLRETGCTALQALWDAVEEIKPEAAVQEYCEQVLGILSALELKVKAGQLYKAGKITLAGFKNIACAQEALTSLLQNLPQEYQAGSCENKRITCSGFTEALSEEAEKVSLTLQPENREGIAVLSAVNLEEAAFKQVYVLGLREHEFPSLKNENWLYSDRERADLTALGIALPSSADGYREDIRFFANACAAASERLVLTFFTDDDQGVSPYIGEVQSLFTNLEIRAKKPQRESGSSLSPAELELALARAGQTVFLHQLTEGSAEAACSDRKRIENITGWNGSLTDTDLLRQVERRIGIRFSASKLETYRGCPFQFLVSYVWQQRPAEEVEEDMDPMQRGSLLHKVLETFISRHLREPLQATRWEELREELDTVFDDTCREFAELGLLYAGDFWQHDQEQLRLLLERWLRNEIYYSEKSAMRPVCTEMSFGKDANLVPMEIEGKQIYLNGKIDRIDQAGNAFYITDYKSGKAPRKAEFLDTNLQLPLYILAADRLMAAKEGGTVAGGGYYVLKDGERQESFLFANAQNISLPWQTYSDMTDSDGAAIPISDINRLREKTEQVLADILQRMEQGDFKPTPSDRCDTYCPAAKICRYRLMKPDQDGEEAHE